MERIVSAQGLRLTTSLRLHQGKLFPRIAPKPPSSCPFLVCLIMSQPNLIEHQSRLGLQEMTWNSRTNFSLLCITYILLGLMTIYYLYSGLGLIADIILLYSHMHVSICSTTIFFLPFQQLWQIFFKLRVERSAVFKTKQEKSLFQIKIWIWYYFTCDTPSPLSSSLLHIWENLILKNTLNTSK